MRPATEGRGPSGSTSSNKPFRFEPVQNVKFNDKNLQSSLSPAGAKSCRAAEGGERPQVNLRPPPTYASSSTDPPFACSVIETLVGLAFAMLIAGLLAKLLMGNNDYREAPDSPPSPSDLAGSSCS